MDVQTLNYYERHAKELVGIYAAAGEGISRYFRRAFAGCRAVLDVGCGSGRDVRLLAEMGIAAEGVDASPAMIAAATAADPVLGKTLRIDRLPELASCPDEAYDGVLCAAVLQHLPDDSLFDTAFAFRRVLKPVGKLLISFPLPEPTVNNGTSRDPGGRLFALIPPTKIQLLLERTGFALLWHEDDQDSLGREHRTWATMLFQRLDGGADRPLHTVESILNRDSKDATYKLALIRALADIAQTQHGQAMWCPDGTVKIPTVAIAGKWLEYYWPLVASAFFIPQKHGEKPNCAKPIAFRRQMSLLVDATRQAGLGGLPGFTVAERSGTLPPSVSTALRTTMRKLKQTVWNMPVRYAGSGEFSVFQYDRNDQTVIMDGSLWREFSLTGSWIVDATILRWGELTARIAKGDLPPSRVIDLLLQTALPERDTDAVRTALAGVASLHCVWTNQTLKTYDIDHAIPYSLWHNNDLWNLFPADHQVNLQKRDKLPSYRLVMHRRDGIVAHWEKMAEAYPSRFICEAKAFCGVRNWHGPNWKSVLFHTLVEAVETTAVQRGIPRWEPGLPGTSSRRTPMPSATAAAEPTIRLTRLSFLPTLEIACGLFRDGETTDHVATIQVADPQGRLDARRHVVAIAKGDSMNWGNQPVNDGDHVLLERIDPCHAGSLTAGGPIAVEYRDPATNQVAYNLKRVSKNPQGEYHLVSSNRNYPPIPVQPETVFPFARLVRVLRMDEVKAHQGFHTSLQPSQLQVADR